MTETYFSNFNIITYANNQAIDLTERVIVLNNVEKNPWIYYPADITNGARADQLAYSNYQDSFASWILYLSNDIVDPYYEWYLSDYEFMQFIKSKYGSMEKAQTKVAYYVNNWVDQNEIYPVTFNALSSGQQKYWEPTHDNYGRISSYSRKKEDWKASTNYVVNLGITGTSNFTSDEVVSIKYNQNSSGKAQVAFSNSSSVVIRHASGDFFPNDTIEITGSSYVYGTESNSNCIITSCTFIANNIPSDEYAYWQEQSHYDVEQLKNEGNKTIRLMQSRYVAPFIRNTKALLGE